MTAHDLLRRLVGGHHGTDHPGRKVLVGRHAAVFDRVSGLAFGWLYRTVADRVVTELPRGGQVLDVGTGPGRLLLELARRRPDAHIIGVDPSADMVGHADRRVRGAGLAGQTETRVAAAEDLPFAEGSFDVVVSSLSAHHWADISTAVAEQARVLRPGGQLWVFDLRGAPSAALTQALGNRFAAQAVTRPELGRVRDAFLVCHRAVKTPSVDGTAV